MINKINKFRIYLNILIDFSLFSLIDNICVKMNNPYIRLNNNYCKFFNIFIKIITNMI